MSLSISLLDASSVVQKAVPITTNTPSLLLYPLDTWNLELISINNTILQAESWLSSSFLNILH